MPRVQTRYPFYSSRNDVIVHLRWNAPHKCGGKQSGDVDWSIITKPRPLSTQEARLQLQSIHNMMSYLTICVSESLPSVTPRHRLQSLMNITESPGKEGQSDEASECKSPWQWRWPCKHMTLSPRALKASVPYYKSKNIYNMHSHKSHPWIKDSTSEVTLRATNR